MSTKTYFTSYWNHTSKNTELYNALFKKLVPASGSCETMHGELLRCISKLHYDVFNNSLCNLDVLSYHAKFTLEHSKNLLEDDQFKIIREYFTGVGSRRNPCNDEDFVNALEMLVDKVVELCKNKCEIIESEVNS